MTLRAFRHAVAVSAVLVGLTGQAHAASKPGAHALDDVRILSADNMEGRGVGTPGGAKARAYIIQRFGQIGLRPQDGKFERPFTFKPRTFGKDVTGVNLVARIQGTSSSDKVLVVSAHYDHLGVRKGQVYNGADDNASGIAGLLAVAEAFKARPPRHTVLIVAFDAEESGLKGAKAFVADPAVPLASIGLNVNFDMISKNAKGQLYVSGAGPQPYLKPVLEGVAKTAPVKLLLGHDTDAEGKENNWTAQSDQGAFAEKGVPWVYFGVEDHPEYHQPTDDFATVPQDFFKRSVATVVSATRALDDDLDGISKGAGR
ncbi:M20/M25/M40 family metallo-hydrolase [Caulobacter sp. Root1472]|jgi:Zn-dependent M28 family amino/carboxypeptidase|uniref:M20/M25/M40 family metallo-hydrolase n=1 Tax=Caulobacter sp. Root1472 TaxID=1736470 RepID=UPI0006F5A60D|nr:M20/M25/M40 family metallo-hydrolase [Caulobacter sp. Root1472]KQZ28993.1 peptidase M20 [Caulobacter sp. Root1472]